MLHLKNDSFMLVDNGIYQTLMEKKAKGCKQMAVLIDPDKVVPSQLHQLLDLAQQAEVDYFFIGGSLLVKDQIRECIQKIRELTDIPTVLFPGSPLQIYSEADAILLLSLISGRNPELLIGQHVVAAPYLKKSGLEVISTGYLLIDGGKPTTASYMSNTLPIPADKGDIAMCTAMAGEMLGLKMIYLDGGSGAFQPVPETVIRMVRQAVSLPLIVGGGIRSPKEAHRAVRAGADLIVVGNILEKEPTLLGEMSAAIKSSKVIDS
jgi:phosphoglycerol geranylgeranyltransferase